MKKLNDDLKKVVESAVFAEFERRGAFKKPVTGDLREVIATAVFAEFERRKQEKQVIQRIK